MYVVGLVVGPNILYKYVVWSTSQISRIKKQIERFGFFPKKLKLYNCVGGQSSSNGFGVTLRLQKSQVELIGVEAGGPRSRKKHAAPLTYGSKIGILHGAAQYVNQNPDGHN